MKVKCLPGISEGQQRVEGHVQKQVADTNKLLCAFPTSPSGLALFAVSNTSPFTRTSGEESSMSHQEKRKEKRKEKES